MEEKDLVFDRRKHICYSKKVKSIVLDQLQKKYPEEKANKLWEQIQLKYVEFLYDLPYLGGKHSRHNGPGGTYDCILIFAYYEVLDDKPTIDELYNMNNETFLPPFKALSKIANLNSKTQQKLLSKIFTTVSKKDEELNKLCPTNYVMEVLPYDKEIGVKYCFKCCPIAEFAKAHNLTHIMPAFCNGDYPAMELLNGELIRKHTCANGDVCDYWIVGKDSELCKKYPKKTSPEGFIYNPDVE